MIKTGILSHVVLINEILASNNIEEIINNIAHFCKYEVANGYNEAGLKEVLRHFSSIYRGKRDAEMKASVKEVIGTAIIRARRVQSYYFSLCLRFENIADIVTFGENDKFKWNSMKEHSHQFVNWTNKENGVEGGFTIDDHGHLFSFRVMNDETCYKVCLSEFEISALENNNYPEARYKFNDGVVYPERKGKLSFMRVDTSPQSFINYELWPVGSRFIGGEVVDGNILKCPETLKSKEELLGQKIIWKIDFDETLKYIFDLSGYDRLEKYIHEIHSINK